VKLSVPAWGISPVTVLVTSYDSDGELAISHIDWAAWLNLDGLVYCLQLCILHQTFHVTFAFKGLSVTLRSGRVNATWDMDHHAMMSTPNVTITALMAPCKFATFRDRPVGDHAHSVVSCHLLMFKFC
jgi:hypothetical protein